MNGTVSEEELRVQLFRSFPEEQAEQPSLLSPAQLHARLSGNSATPMGYWSSQPLDSSKYIKSVSPAGHGQ
jgi:hypothetical protein